MTKENKKQYDVIIAGASFAGLSVASKVRNGQSLLIDTKPIGVGIKSACGTILDTASQLGLDDCVSQTHKKIVLHIGRGELIYHLNPPFCVIDEEKFCRQLFAKGQAEFIQASIQDFDGTLLKTDQGNFQSDIFVDASGPNSVLTKNKCQHLSFGLETTVDYQAEGLHFWYEPKVLPRGIFWIFPQGDTSRVGVGSYVGKTNLVPELSEFLARFNLKKSKLRGGYFPHRIEKPISEDIFLVGDAAGQCLPITGEGIRPAIFFGQKLGEIIDSILEGKITRAEGLDSYRDFVLQGRQFKYEALFRGQKLLTNIPQPLFHFLAWIVHKRPFNSFVLSKYLRILK